jgi:hypothetical protein
MSEVEREKRPLETFSKWEKYDFSETKKARGYEPTCLAYIPATS